MLVLIEGFCQANHISEDDMFNVRLVLDEAVINVIVHGYDDTAEHDINVSLALDVRPLTIHIDDDGIAYNPLDAPLAAVRPARSSSAALAGWAFTS